MSCNSQNKIILKHLQKRSITAREAMLHYGIYRLAARINDLRNEGYEIKTLMIKRKNAAGRTVSYAEYSLVIKKPSLLDGLINKAKQLLTGGENAHAIA